MSEANEHLHNTQFDRDHPLPEDTPSPRATALTPEAAKALSDRVCDAASPLLFATGGSDVGRLVEAALECASALLAASEALASGVSPSGKERGE